jgi:hypothetical protein
MSVFGRFVFFFKKAKSFGGSHYHILKEHTLKILKPVLYVLLQFFGVKHIFGKVSGAVGDLILSRELWEIILFLEIHVIGDKIKSLTATISNFCRLTRAMSWIWRE